MAVLPKISFLQSPDAKKLILIDSSDYTTGVIGDYTRKVELWSGINGTGEKIADLPFVGNELTVDYNLTADRYISAKLMFTGSPTVATVYVNFTTRNYEMNALYKKTNKGCGCQNKNCSPTFYGFIDMYLAQVATEGGNSGLANSLITSSYKWLQQ